MGFPSLKKAIMDCFHEFLEASLRKMLDDKQRDTLWRAKVQTVITLAMVFNICKAVFGIWHSALWVSASMHLQGSDRQAPCPLTFAARPLREALAELPRVSQRERLNRWLDTAETSDEPFAGYHDLFIQIMELEHDLDLLGAYVDRVPGRLGDDAWSEATLKLQSYSRLVVLDDTLEAEVDSDSSSVFTDVTTDSTGRTAL